MHWGAASRCRARPHTALPGQNRSAAAPLPPPVVCTHLLQAALGGRVGQAGQRRERQVTLLARQSARPGGREGQGRRSGVREPWTEEIRSRTRWRRQEQARVAPGIQQHRRYQYFGSGLTSRCRRPGRLAPARAAASPRPGTAPGSAAAGRCPPSRPAQAQAMQKTGGRGAIRKGMHTAGKAGRQGRGTTTAGDAAGRAGRPQARRHHAASEQAWAGLRTDGRGVPERPHQPLAPLACRR